MNRRASVPGVGVRVILVECRSQSMGHSEVCGGFSTPAMTTTSKLMRSTGGMILFNSVQAEQFGNAARIWMEVDFEPPPAVEIAPSRTGSEEGAARLCSFRSSLVTRKGSLYQRHSIVVAQAGYANTCKGMQTHTNANMQSSKCSKCSQRHSAAPFGEKFR